MYLFLLVDLDAEDSSNSKSLKTLLHEKKFKESQHTTDNDIMVRD